MPSTAKGILYVSVWVMLWGTAASLADIVLLQRNVYGIGSAGQGLTFVAYGIAALVLAIRLAPRYLRRDP